MLKDEMENIIYDMEKVARLFAIEPFDIYLLGGAACILGGYTERATMDFDFVNLEYSSRLGRVFAMMRDFDMLDYELAVLSPVYKSRAGKLNQFEYLNIYVLSVEDIIVSKIIRLEKKDCEDIDILIKQADKALIKKIIAEVLSRKDLMRSKKLGFKSKLPLFKELYNV